MSINALDQAFSEEQTRLEIEQLPARQQFDELVKIVSASQILTELGIGFSVGDREMAFAKGDYIVTAKLDGVAINVGLKKPGCSDPERHMLIALSAIYRPSSDAEIAAGQIGSLIARIIENRFLW